MKYVYGMCSVHKKKFTGIMYDVDPQTTGLKAYWKFNEGKGNNIAKDLTGNGNDAVAYTTAIYWRD